LREAACEQMLTESKHQEPEKQSIAPSGWSVAMITDEPTTKTVNIEIGSFKIAVTSETDQELLAKICRTLMQI
jgi:hypothetical protein